MIYFKSRLASLSYNIYLSRRVQSGNLESDHIPGSLQQSDGICQRSVSGGLATHSEQTISYMDGSSSGDKLIRCV